MQGNRRIADDIDYELQIQESNLSDTRSTHYIYQGLLIGVVYVSIYTMISIVFTSNIGVAFDLTSPLNKYAPMIYFVLMFIVAASTLMLIRYGSALLWETSQRVVTRGRVIDALQHVKLMHMTGRGEEISSLFPIEFQSHLAFLLVKIVEGLSEGDPLNGYSKDFIVDYKRPKFLGPEDRAYGFQYDLIKYAEFISYRNNILDLDYKIHGYDKKKQRRLITQFRSGHYAMFVNIWRIARLLIICTLLALFSRIFLH